MGALNQPSAGEIERRRAVWALNGLGWVFACLALNAFGVFFGLLLPPSPYDPPLVDEIRWEIDDAIGLVQMCLRGDWDGAFSSFWMWRDTSILIPLLMGAAAFATFLAAKGVGCRQRWARGLGAAVAVFATILLPLMAFGLCYRVGKNIYDSSSLWRWIDYRWLVMSVLLLFLGVSVLCTMIRMRLIERSGR